MGCVYQVTNKINGKKYIGKTIGTIDIRRYKHLYDLKIGRVGYFHQALKKYGIENFEWIVLKESNDNDILFEFEIYYIKQLNTKMPFGYNLTDGGEGAVGLKVSEETKEKLRLTNLGKHHSEETKRKMSTSHKGNMVMLGRHLSEKTKEKVRIARLGKTKSEETKRNMSIARMGRLITPEMVNKRLATMRSKNGGVLYSPETLKRMSLSKKGTHWSIEQRAKIKATKEMNKLKRAKQINTMYDVTQQLDVCLN